MGKEYTPFKMRPFSGFGNAPGMKKYFPKFGKWKEGLSADPSESIEEKIDRKTEEKVDEVVDEVVQQKSGDGLNI
tara:strand:+ start:442 stop:666 length:225 start_codon:yes stop_codon:yes gene_type:complete